ncbi:hypothetical protein niasHS_010774 [Heterodera schachtii]|uniref:Uncharacterized protein n=1 Tax=Heterodera schachtii TaxID=97005 RepID=A0ABD2ISK4_HETSC
MHVTGLIWTLYPLLGLFAVLEFIVGLAHVFFCLPFAHFYLSFWSGISAAITSVYALLLDYPNKCELLLQFVSAFFAFCLSLTALIENVCIRRVHARAGQLSFCAGLLNRTTPNQMQCDRILGHLQVYLVQKVSPAPVEQSLHSARLFVSSLITFCAIAQFFSGIILFSYSARSNRFRLTSSHWHCIFALVILLLSLIHSHYCAPLFFTYIVPLIGIYSLIFALLPSSRTSHSGKFAFRQFLAIVGFALATSLISVCSFSIFCWANRPNRTTFHYPYRTKSEELLPLSLRLKADGEQGVLRFCAMPEGTYEHCERVLDFSFPYLNWPIEQVENEKAIVRIVLHSLLSVCAVGLIFLFISEAFCMS